MSMEEPKPFAEEFKVLLQKKYCEYLHKRIEYFDVYYKFEQEAEVYHKFIKEHKLIEKITLHDWYGVQNEKLEHITSVRFVGVCIVAKNLLSFLNNNPKIKSLEFFGFGESGWRYLHCVCRSSNEDITNVDVEIIKKNIEMDYVMSMDAFPILYSRTIGSEKYGDLYFRSRIANIYFPEYTWEALELVEIMKRNMNFKNLRVYLLENENEQEIKKKRRFISDFGVNKINNYNEILNYIIKIGKLFEFFYCFDDEVEMVKKSFDNLKNEINNHNYIEEAFSSFYHNVRSFFLFFKQKIFTKILGKICYLDIGGELLYPSSLFKNLKTVEFNTDIVSFDNLPDTIENVIIGERSAKVLINSGNYNEILELIKKLKNFKRLDLGKFIQGFDYTKDVADKFQTFTITYPLNEETFKHIQKMKNLKVLNLHCQLNYDYIFKILDCFSDMMYYDTGDDKISWKIFIYDPDFEFITQNSLRYYKYKEKTPNFKTKEDYDLNIKYYFC